MTRVGGSGGAARGPGLRQQLSGVAAARAQALEQLSRPFPWLVTGRLMGGERKKAEKARLRKGLAVVVATPGRVSDHLESTACFQLVRCEVLVLDEAGRPVQRARWPNAGHAPRPGAPPR